MKYLKIILTIIAILSMSIVFKLINLQTQFAFFNHNIQISINSNQQLESAISRFDTHLVEFRKQIEELNNKFFKKNNTTHQ